MGAAFCEARDLLLRYRSDYEAAVQEFQWPALENFNWATDYFDLFADGNRARALWIVDEDGTAHTRSFQEMSQQSSEVANYLDSLGVQRGDRVLLMLGHHAALWETFLACMKLGAVVVPAATTLTRRDIEDRLERGRIRHLVVDAGCTQGFAGLDAGLTRIAVGDAGEAPDWHYFGDSRGCSNRWTPRCETRAGDPLLLYFTSGTTSRPKLVVHSHFSYPVGHLSTMFWVGIQRADVHWNISSPGWAKHAWSGIFAPWNAGATSFHLNYRRFNAKAVLETLMRHPVTTLCAPPTVWRMLVQEDLGDYKTSLREAVSAGEPLNPEVIEQVGRAWGLYVRDGYGQTETTALVGNSPGQPLKPGSMGRVLPGYVVDLLDADGQTAGDGEVCVRMTGARSGLMLGYADQDGSYTAPEGSHYRTGDVAQRDAEGYITFVGRADDVFKSSDYRLSPFELESVLLEHPAVAEAAVVPSPDPLRNTVPKAFITLSGAYTASRETAAAIFAHTRAALPHFKQIRIIEFAPLPKTISGKIRRVELKATESERRRNGIRGEAEFFEGELRAAPSGSLLEVRQ